MQLSYNNMSVCHLFENNKMYSLHFIKHVVNMDVSRHILESRYIHISDMFYGMEGVHFKLHNLNVARLYCDFI
jgi:hypothetical protein